jgi:hypothetical protein
MQDGALLQDVSRLSQSMTERPVQVQHAWCPRVDGEFSYQRQADGGNAAGFYSSCEQSNELRAEGSGRHEQREMHSRPLHPSPYLVCRSRIVLWIVREAKAIVFLSHTSNDSFALQFAQAF